MNKFPLILVFKVFFGNKNKRLNQNKSTEQNKDFL